MLGTSKQGLGRVREQEHQVHLAVTGSRICRMPWPKEGSRYAELRSPTNASAC